MFAAGQCEAGSGYCLHVVRAGQRGIGAEGAGLVARIRPLAWSGLVDVTDRIRNPFSSCARVMVGLAACRSGFGGHVIFAATCTGSCTLQAGCRSMESARAGCPVSRTVPAARCGLLLHPGQIGARSHMPDGVSGDAARWRACFIAYLQLDPLRKTHQRWWQQSSPPCQACVPAGGSV